MPTVHDIVFCLNATNNEGQGASALTILSVLNPEYVPGLFSFSTVITILGLELDTEYKMKVNLSKDDEVLGTIEGSISLADDGGNLPVEYKGINLSIDWNNINFKEQGECTLTVIVNEVQLREKRIFVKGKNQP